MKSNFYYLPSSPYSVKEIQSKKTSLGIVQVHTVCEGTAWPFVTKGCIGFTTFSYFGFSHDGSVSLGLKLFGGTLWVKQTLVKWADLGN